MEENKLFLAEYRFYDAKHGFEVQDEVLSYGILAEKDGDFYNIFNIQEDLPVFMDTNTPTFTRDGEMYGFKKKAIYKNPTEDTFAWVIANKPVTFKDYNEACEYIDKNPRFFKDRRRDIELKNPIGYLKRVAEDRKNNRKLKEFVNSKHGVK